MNLSLVDIVRRDPHGPHRKESKNVNVISTGRTVISRSISLVLEQEEEYEQDIKGERKQGAVISGRASHLGHTLSNTREEPKLLD